MKLNSPYDLSQNRFTKAYCRICRKPHKPKSTSPYDLSNSPEKKYCNCKQH